MKKFLLLSLMALAFLSLNANVYTLDLQSGSLTKGKSDTAPTRTAGHKNAAMRSEESIIDENKVWMYVYSDMGKADITYCRFNGTYDINGKEYHKLYQICKNVEYNEENYNEAVEKMNSIPEFDFDSMNPNFYFRQEGKKYYMLCDCEHEDLIANVRTLDGESVYGEYYRPFRKYYCSAVTTAAEEKIPEYYGTDGRRVYGDPAPGVYIERKGESVRKVVIK